MRKEAWERSQRGLFALVTAPVSAARGRNLQEARRLVEARGALSPGERVEIYRRMFWGRLLDSLLEDFPGVASLLGSDAFTRQAESYVAQHGSRSHALRDLGKAFPSHLRQQVGARRPDVVDMARYEWAQIEAFDGAAQPPAEGGSLSQPRLRLSLQPHVRLLTVAYPVGEYAAGVKSGGVLRSAASQAWLETSTKRLRGAPQLRAEPRYGLAVHRWQGKVYYKRLERGEARVLAQFRKGATLRAATSVLAASARRAPAEVADNLTRWFRAWAALGWLVQGRV
ncbi:putative DNA-binding domain-containing protein [Nibricoccus sp. IMCC34717]|uniref:HvfC/BufC family peptide modification chaperone n=1 Tax=Nibricoccus sp. IMCC34717 TaxID=3034021 RepID=UPI003850FAA6